MIKLKLPLFLEVVQQLEVQGTAERAFWAAVQKEPNLLGKPLNQSSCETIENFLIEWRSKRHEFGWVDLQAYWTPEMQRIASSATSELLKANFDGKLEVGQHRLTLSHAVEILFGRLSMTEGIGATNASKILALSNPRFFVMWDQQNIRSLYGLSPTPKGYSTFLTNMQAYGQELIGDVSRQENLNEPDAITWLEERPLDPSWKAQYPRRKPIAKLLDEYNYHLPTWLKTNIDRLSS